MKPILRVQDLEKVFWVNKRHQGILGSALSLVAPQMEKVTAVSQVNFSLEPGEMVGYLGPNGAGKSTTIKILTGLLVPSGGEVEASGFVPWKQRQAYVAHIGAVFGQRTTLWWDLPVIDSFELLQAMYSIPAERFRRNLREFTEMLEMERFINTPVRSLSLGQRMRADLCAALLHEPSLVFLDEPTIGLDVVAKERIRQFIQKIHQERGTTIILTTHDLSDVEKLCSRVLILDQGQLLYDGSLAALSQRFDGRRLLAVTLANPAEQITLEGAEIVSRDGPRVTFLLDGHTHDLAALIQTLLARYPVTDLEVRRPELEVTIRRIYEEKLLQPAEQA